MNLRAHNRREVWMPIVERVQDQKVLYLEFGVWEGASMRFWSEHLSHPGSSLHGFDSFEGLPETEGKWWSKGQFDVNGRVPVIDDPRVQFFKGWFDQTLPDYTPPEHDVLVVNIDADLYSSTICVLRHLKPHIRRGSFLYFDEFHHPESEQRALEEFMDETHLNVSVVSGTKNFVHMCFECTSPP
jgi:hypothetical protein